jgi:hypothetical protein
LAGLLVSVCVGFKLQLYSATTANLTQAQPAYSGQDCVFVFSKDAPVQRATIIRQISPDEFRNLLRLWIEQRNQSEKPGKGIYGTTFYQYSIEYGRDGAYTPTEDRLFVMRTPWGRVATFSGGTRYDGPLLIQFNDSPAEDYKRWMLRIVISKSAAGGISLDIECNELLELPDFITAIDALLASESVQEQQAPGEEAQVPAPSLVKPRPKAKTGPKTRAEYVEGYQRIYEEQEDRKKVLDDLLARWEAKTRAKGLGVSPSDIEAELKRLHSGIRYLYRKGQKLGQKFEP